MTLSKPQAARLRKIVRGRSDASVHVLEGPKAVIDALSLGVVTELWAASDVQVDTRRALKRAADTQGLIVQHAKRSELERIGDTVTTSGVLAVVRDTSLPWQQLRRKRGPVLWLDGVQDPGNVGAMFRIAAAFSMPACVVTEGCAYPLGTKALRASAGMALHVPFARTSRDTVLAEVHRGSREVWVAAAGGSSVFESPPLPEAALLVIGSEARGVHESVRMAASRVVSVPIAAHVESLNAAVAAGIVVATLCRVAGASGA